LGRRRRDREPVAPEEGAAPRAAGRARSRRAGPRHDCLVRALTATSGAATDGAATTLANGSIAYAGEPGAFAEDAALAAFGGDLPRAPLGGFRDVFEAVADGTADRGVVPIENLVNGSVREVYDLLLAHDLVIVGEVIVPVELCLAALPGQRLEAIERVYSHIQALGQAERFLRGRGWTLLTTYNTAGAGKLISEGGEGAAAAVLSRRAAERFGLEVIADSIQDVPDNRTRFIVLARHDDTSDAGTSPRAATGGASTASDADAAFRTTLAFAVRNEPGTLLRALGAFAAHGINLSNLESRPSRSAAWEYVFWADLDARATSPECQAALSELAAASTMVRVLGSFARHAS
jgi:prephenate dehydratase